MKKYICYFATMLLVLAVTDMCMGGSVLHMGFHEPYGISASISGVKDELKKLPEQEGIAEEIKKELDMIIELRSCNFVRAAFNRDKAVIDDMLAENAEYIVAGDKSSYIRYTSGDLNVEGYMATDKRLEEVRQSWYVTEDDGTVTSGVEVRIEGENTAQVWYIHYRKSQGEWEIFMLENGV